MKRLFLVLSLIAFWLLGGIALEACAPFPPPNSPAPTMLATAQPAAKLPNSIWVWSGGAPRALDVQTGHTLANFGEALGEFAATRDDKWQFAPTFDLDGSQWTVYLTALDMVHGVGSYRIPIFSAPDVGTSLYKEILITTELSADEQTAFVALTRQQEADWVTDIIRVNLAARAADPPATVLRAPASWGPNPTIALTPDEKSLLIARANSRYEGVKRLYSTHAAQVDATTLQVLQTFDIPGDVQADSDWAQVESSPAGNALYIFESIWRDSGASEMRFSNIDLATGALTVSVTHQRDMMETGCDSRFHPVAAEPTHAWQWCITFVQFLDLATGEITAKVQLPAGLAGGSFAEYVVTRDGNTLYTSYPLDSQVVALDLAARTVTKRVALPERASNPDFCHALSELFVKTANAKGLARPALALSYDETWLSFVSLSDFDTVDGVWVMDLTTFEPRGQWLRGQEIVGIRSSFDSAALYAFDRTSMQIQTIAPGTGEIISAFQVPSDEGYGFLADVLP